jgi:thiamine-phosphate diphosphorylase
VHVLADDAARWKWSPVEQARAACAGGASVVQLRAKTSSDACTLELAREIREVTRAHGVLFVVNDRFDLALLSEADGVHLGQGDLDPSRLPLQARESLLIGRSTHTAEQAQRARQEPVDYVAFGPVFGTASKESEWTARGSDGLREIAAIAAPLPLVAIGGIDAHNAAGVARGGAQGIAVISAVSDAPDPEASVRALVVAFGAEGASVG